MKIKEILMESNMYTAYVLDEASRKALALKFPPKYTTFVGHHVTQQFGVPADTEAPKPAQVVVVGRIDSGDGLEALVVSVDGTVKRPDGKIYHITWSHDANYKPVDSNDLLAKKRYTLTKAVPVTTTPELLK